MLAQIHHFIWDNHFYCFPFFIIFFSHNSASSNLIKTYFLTLSPLPIFSHNSFLPLTVSLSLSFTRPCLCLVHSLSSYLSLVQSISMERTTIFGLYISGSGSRNLVKSISNFQASSQDKTRFLGIQPAHC